MDWNGFVIVDDAVDEFTEDAHLLGPAVGDDKIPNPSGVVQRYVFQFEILHVQVIIVGGTTNGPNKKGTIVEWKWRVVLNLQYFQYRRAFFGSKGQMLIFPFDKISG